MLPIFFEQRIGSILHHSGFQLVVTQLNQYTSIDVTTGSINDLAKTNLILNPNALSSWSISLAKLRLSFIDVSRF
jgi:hypothetical protein